MFSQNQKNEQLIKKIINMNDSFLLSIVQKFVIVLTKFVSPVIIDRF